MKPMSGKTLFLVWMRGCAGNANKTLDFIEKSDILFSVMRVIDKLNDWIEIKIDRFNDWANKTVDRMNEFFINLPF